MTGQVRALLGAAALVAVTSCGALTDEEAEPVPVLARHDVVAGEDGLVPARFEGIEGEPVTFHNRTRSTLRFVAADGSFRSPPVAPGATWTLVDPPVGDRLFATSVAGLGRAVLSVGPPDAPSAAGANAEDQVHGVHLAMG